MSAGNRKDKRENAEPNSFFDLSFRGALPEILRALAAKLEAGEVQAEQFDWRLSKDRLEFTARIDMLRDGSHP